MTTSIVPFICICAYCDLIVTVVLKSKSVIDEETVIALAAVTIENLLICEIHVELRVLPFEFQIDALKNHKHHFLRKVA